MLVTPASRLRLSARIAGSASSAATPKQRCRSSGIMKAPELGRRLADAISTTRQASHPLDSACGG
ncbi:hypothetical protein [Sorangium sp. So ce124]|uniref:hypothetical protein n=1 Tax=Sorangium sp. So ce124 TaxID=3133280 RepID=UPI003F647347